MTANQIISHTEQMEAARSEFRAIWEKDILPTLYGFSCARKNKMKDMELRIASHAAWIAFLSGKGIRKPA